MFDGKMHQIVCPEIQSSRCCLYLIGFGPSLTCNRTVFCHAANHAVCRATPCSQCHAYHASTMPYRAKPCNTMQHLAIFLRNIQQCRTTYIMKNTCNIQCNNKQHHIRAVTCNIDATRGNPVVPCLGRGRPGHPVRDGFVRSRLEHGERGAHALQA